MGFSACKVVCSSLELQGTGPKLQVSPSDFWEDDIIMRNMNRIFLKKPSVSSCVILYGLKGADTMTTSTVVLVARL
jgi:hypothetical protein